MYINYVVFGLARQDRRDVVVGGRCQVHGVVFSPNWQPCAALHIGEVISVAEAAEQVEGGNGEAMLLPLRLQHPKAWGAVAQQDLVEVHLFSFT